MNPQTQLDQVAALISSMAHPLRLKIIGLLYEQGEVNVSSLQKQVPAEKKMVSHHLNKMKQQGMVKSVSAGHRVLYSLVDLALSEGLIRFVNR